MNDHVCTAVVPVVTLTEYWLGELDSARESAVEEHLFGCAHCAGRLRSIVQLAEGIRRATREGRQHAVFSASFVRKLQDDGLRVREYRLQPGGSVACTVAPDDDLVVAHLHAPLQDVRQLDLVVDDLTAGTQVRLHDVAFDARAGEIVLASNVTTLRRLPSCTQRMQLVSVEGAAERPIGTYTFNHSPHPPRD
jgi:hypothetical protein